MAEGRKTIVNILSTFGLVAIAIGLWNVILDSPFIYHDRLMTVESSNWSVGEYKRCTTLTGVDVEQPSLVCGDGFQGKVFKVRFYGPETNSDKPNSIEFRWQCEKNEGTDPNISCTGRKENVEPARPQSDSKTEPPVRPSPPPAEAVAARDRAFASCMDLERKSTSEVNAINDCLAIHAKLPGQN